MKTLKTYGSLPETLIDKSRLEDAGLSPIIQGENSGSIGYGGLFGAITIEVPDEEWERAVAILEEPPHPLPDNSEQA
jgi:hypothetical protein